MTTDSKVLVDFLMKVPAQELIEGTTKTLTEDVSIHYFTLVIRELIIIVIILSFCTKSEILRS